MYLIKYNKENIDKYFLSPYVKICECDGNITFYNHIFETSITLTDFSMCMNEFIKVLENGACEELLYKYFKENISAYSPDEILSLFIRKGVIV